MPFISFEEKDLLRGKVYPVSWYRVLIMGVGEKPAKNGESTNWVVEGKILKDADTGDTEFAEHPLEWNFNSKAPGFAIGFFNAFGIETQANKRYDWNGFVGKVLDVFVENDMYEGRMVNRVNHKYRAPREE